MTTPRCRATSQRMANQSALEGRGAGLQGRGRRTPARHGARRAHARAAGRREAVALHAREAVRQCARRADRQPGDAAGEGRPRCDLSVGLAGRGRRQPVRARCIRTSRCIPRTPCRPSSAASTTRCVRADQIHHAEGNDSIDWFKPIVADAEAGFGGVLNAFELMKQHDRSGRRRRALRGSAVVREEVRPHGRQGAGADSEAINKLVAARLAADVCGVPTVLVARTDAESANLLTSDVDERDRPFIELEGAHQRRLLLRERRASSRRSRAASRTRRTRT